ncbi:MAG TPA: aminotransferase class IV [Prolixibacteraceae bacterium]
MKGGYFLFNGQFHKEGDPVFTLADLSQRALGFNEFFRAEHNEILFPLAISKHLIATAETIGLEISGMIGHEGRLLQKAVSRLLNKNKLYLAARIGIQVYPSEEKINILLTAEEMERGYYPLKEPGLLLSLYDTQTTGTFSFQTGLRLAGEQNKPDLIILDGSGFTCGSLFCSIAYIEKDQVFFMKERSDRKRCAIREEVFKSAKEVGLVPTEKENVTPEMLLEADEVFLFDACSGIQKVLGLEDRRYFSPKTKLIAEKLSERAKKGK